MVNATPRPLYPRERPGTHCIRGWVGSRASLDGCGKFRPPPGFDPPTVQPIASRYTDCAIPAHLHNKITLKLLCKKKESAWIEFMTRERGKWRALVNTARNRRVQQNAGNFSAGRGTLKTTLLHGFR